MAAIITGSTGQDGSYLCELLVEKGYHVKCLNRRSVVDQHHNVTNYIGNVTDQSIIEKMINDCDEYTHVEIYNLAAHSQFDFYLHFPKCTFEVNTLGILNILETVRKNKNPKKFRVFQASSSEMFGHVNEFPQNEMTPFHPKTIYGVSKVSAHLLVKNYREKYDIHASSGILFNHESPRRGKTFVTKKIVETLKDIFNGKSNILEIGNLSTKKDWGHARDYVESMWIMLQQDKPGDYVVATGKTYSVREFIELTVNKMGKIIRWEGDGETEVGIIDEEIVVKVSPEFYRPCDECPLVGDNQKIQNIGWSPKRDIHDLIQDMLKNNINTNKR